MNNNRSNNGNHGGNNGNHGNGNNGHPGGRIRPPETTHCAVTWNKQ